MTAGVENDTLGSARNDVRRTSSASRHRYFRHGLGNRLVNTMTRIRGLSHHGLAGLVSFVTRGDHMSSDGIFHFDVERPSFESFSKENGFRYWLASDLVNILGYSSYEPVRKAVNAAMAACASLDISITDNFKEASTPGSPKDFKLSRFACYLTVMNADSRKQPVAAAQAYFITMAEAFRQFVQQAEDVERVMIRGEIADQEKSLSGTAASHGIQNYAFFQNSGYRGLYNMDLAQIRKHKGVPDGRSPLDFMGKTELAANLFRITQTDEKIRNERLTGQQRLEGAAEQVGRKVRKSMIEISGSTPEALPPAKDIKVVKKGLKRSHSEYKKLDKPK